MACRVQLLLSERWWNGQYDRWWNGLLLSDRLWNGHSDRWWNGQPCSPAIFWKVVKWPVKFNCYFLRGGEMANMTDGEMAYFLTGCEMAILTDGEMANRVHLLFSERWSNGWFGQREEKETWWNPSLKNCVNVTQKWSWNNIYPSDKAMVCLPVTHP